eukprot:364059-Chlamydomonas_euryale.AAC.9
MGNDARWETGNETKYGGGAGAQEAGRWNGRGVHAGEERPVASRLSQGGGFRVHTPAVSVACALRHILVFRLTAWHAACCGPRHVWPAGWFPTAMTSALRDRELTRRPAPSLA